MSHVVTLASRETDRQTRTIERGGKRGEKGQEESAEHTIWEGSLGTGMPQVVTLTSREMDKEGEEG
jgi:hypothetical protein